MDAYTKSVLFEKTHEELRRLLRREHSTTPSEYRRQIDELHSEVYRLAAELERLERLRGKPCAVCEGTGCVFELEDMGGYQVNTRFSCTKCAGFGWNKE